VSAPRKPNAAAASRPPCTAIAKRLPPKTRLSPRPAHAVFEQRDNALVGALLMRIREHQMQMRLTLLPNEKCLKDDCIGMIGV